MVNISSKPVAGFSLAPGLRTICKNDFLGELIIVIRGNSPKLELQSDIRKNSLTTWVMQPWEQFPELGDLHS